MEPEKCDCFARGDITTNGTSYSGRRASLVVHLYRIRTGYMTWPRAARGVADTVLHTTMWDMLLSPRFSP